MAARRVRNVLRPYLRAMGSGERWWWVAVPGAGRKALGLREEAAGYDEAHRVACERFAAGALAPGAPGAPAEASLEGLVETYLTELGPRWKPRTKAGYELLLLAFLDEMTEQQGVERASEVTSELWSAYVAERQLEVENGTINRLIAVLRPMAKWGRARSPVLLPAPVYLESLHNLKELGRQPSPLIPSPDEWRAMVGELARGVSAIAYPEAERYRAWSEVNDRGLALVIVVAVQTGLRVDELRHLRGEDIGSDEVRVAARSGWSPKSHRERTIPVPASTARHAREMVAWRDAAKGLNGTAFKLGEGWINKRLDLAWKRLSIVGDAPRMHDCRRTFATELSRAGHPITLVRDRLGHADVQTTERYLGRYRSDRDRVVLDLGLGAALGEGGR